MPYGLIEDIINEKVDFVYQNGDEMRVRDIMTRNVVTIDAEASVSDACEKYSTFRVGCLVITDDYVPVGIITERDIIEKVVRMNKNPKKTKAKDIMSSNLKTIHASAKIEEAADIMKKNTIKKLPVILDNRIVGIITVTDISNVFPNFTKNALYDEQPFRFV